MLLFGFTAEYDILDRMLGFDLWNYSVSTELLRILTTLETMYSINVFYTNFS